MVLLNAESSYQIENGEDKKYNQETDLKGIEEPMKSAIKLIRKKLPDLELRRKLWDFGCYEKKGTLHCTGRRRTLLRTIIHYASIYLTLQMFFRGNDEE